MTIVNRSASVPPNIALPAVDAAPIIGAKLVPRTPMNLTLTERYLAGYHDANPGVTSRAFAQLGVSNGTRPFASTYHALVSTLPEDDAPLAVLDLACGDGHLLGLLAESAAAHTLIGIDLSDGELAAARARLGDRAALYPGKGQQLPLASRSVEAVLRH